MSTLKVKVNHVKLTRKRLLSLACMLLEELFRPMPQKNHSAHSADIGPWQLESDPDVQMWFQMAAFVIHQAVATVARHLWWILNRAKAGICEYLLS